MSTIKLKTFGLSCVYFLCVIFSVAVNAADPHFSDPGVSIEGWLPVGGQELPILNFEGVEVDDEILQDIRVENVTVDSDGSTRFQLSNSGLMSRQVFAHVRRVEQDDGFTRSIITNVADGAQMEFLTRTASDPMSGKTGKSGNSFSIQKSSGGDQTALCPLCPLITIIVSEAVCAIQTSIAYSQCRMNCQRLGGVKSFRSGFCGMYNSECQCMVDPLRTWRELGVNP